MCGGLFASAQRLGRSSLAFSCVAKHLLEPVQWLEKEQENGRAKQEAEHQAGPTEHFNNEKIEVAFRRAAHQYQVKPYAGAVTLFRPKPAIFYRLSGGRCLKENRDILLSDNGWSEHVVQLSVSEVPGDHDSMVLDPYVRVLAERMRAIVAEAVEKRKSKGAGPAQPLQSKTVAQKPVIELA